MQGSINTEDNVIRVVAGQTCLPRCCHQLPEAQLIKAANCVRNISRSLHGLPCQEWERIGGPVSRARHVEAINVMQTA
jgi:hypothetical protein